MKRKLFKIRAHIVGLGGIEGRSLTYFVVAKSTTEAEGAVSKHHSALNYWPVQWFESQTIAEPEVLLIP